MSLKVITNQQESNISVVEAKDNSNVVKMPKLKKDGTPKKTKSNGKVDRDDTMPFKTEDVEEIIKHFDGLIKNSYTDQDKYNNRRNKTYFVAGINIGLRNGDLTNLKWGDVYNGHWNFWESKKITPEKTSKSNKKVKLFFNDAFKTAIEEFKIFVKPKSLDEYIFVTRESVNDGKPISYKMAYRVIKNVAVDVGIEYNVGTHSLRKTFGRQRYELSNDKSRTLVELMKLFRHEDLNTTLNYICIGDDELSTLFNAVNLGSKEM